MVSRRNIRGWFLGLITLSLLLSCYVSRPQPFAAPTDASAAEKVSMAGEKSAVATETDNPISAEAQARWDSVVVQATEAAGLAQTARTAQDWDEVTVAWAEAINELQAIPVGSPQRVFAQRKGREYVQNLAIAQQRAEQSSAPQIFPTFGSPILDEQIGLYLSYIATIGPPDVLVMGSSRALQGVDPQALQQGLAAQGYPGLKVFNFSINGATAQVMSFVLRQVLKPEQLPQLVVWADGSRAFNSGRFDRTFAEILNSPGYQAVRAGTLPQLAEKAADPMPNAVTLPISAITAQGFLTVEDRFDPATYYRQFPRVSGRYDGFYSPFQLEGVQSLSLEAIATYLRSQQVPLVVVNLPLSDDYLDAVRLRYEQQFQQYLRQQGSQNSFIVIDLLQQWRNQNQFFADPSHVNRFGAAELGKQLAANPQIPWNLFRSQPAAS
ncbi:MAG: hypothetical protein ICV77_06645 [Cyanobacteria bacterium Co-bin8]|nr:hypothetical protein [Cyanobacteria bacterium Co-bin8]